MLRSVTPQSALGPHVRAVLLCHLIPRKLVLELDLSCFKLVRPSIYPRCLKRVKHDFHWCLSLPASRILLKGPGNPRDTLRLTQTSANPDQWGLNYASAHFIQGGLTLVKPNLASVSWDTIVPLPLLISGMN